MSHKILALNPNSYQKHLIHGEGRDWAETNCYTDLWIELLHAMGHEPIAALPFVFSIDFEGDQWTFFKFAIADLESLYGLNIQELNIWRNLLSCIEEQTNRGNFVLVELDSFYLPDTAGTAYKIEHTKTTVAVNEIDRTAGRMEYFHNQGYFELGGDDFEQLFLVSDTLDKRVLPPYVEFVKKKRDALQGDELLQASLTSFKSQLALMPEQNPFQAFMTRFTEDFRDLASVDIDYFHKYSFATLRQYGAAFELCKTYLNWLQSQNVHVQSLQIAIDAYSAISESTKVLQFQLARAIARKKPLDLSILEASALHWQQARDVLLKTFA